MYKNLISAVVLAGFGLSNFSPSLVFAKGGRFGSVVGKGEKTKGKDLNLGNFKKSKKLNKKAKKSATGKQKAREINEKTKFIMNWLSKIGVYKILLPICLPTASFVIARHFLNKGQWSENVKDVEVSATENAKEKEITEKDTDSGNSIKQPNQKTLEQPEVNNKDLNKEVGNIDSKDSKVTYKAGFAVVGFGILAIIIYNYLNRAIIEEKQENGASTYKVNLNKASKDQLETLRNKLKVGDKILLNFKVLKNNRDEFLKKINIFLKGNNNNNKMLPILDYEKCEDDLMGILEERENFIGQTKSLSFKALDDYSGTIISLKEKLEKSENLDIFEANLNLINKGFGQIYTEGSETGVSTFGEILQLAVSSSLIDFTYLRVEKKKLSDAFHNFAMNNIAGWKKHLDLCQNTGLTGIFYSKILDKVEDNRKDKPDVNNGNSSSYKKVSTAPSAKDLLDFIDVINKFYNRNYEILELKGKNLGVNKNLIYTNLLKKFILYIFSNGNTVAKRELYRSEKYELFTLFRKACAIEESISFKMKDEEIKKLLVGLENDDKQPSLLNLLKNFLERFKNNTIKEQAPAKFDAVTIEELAKIYNKDYIKNRLDVFSGEFWELFDVLNKFLKSHSNDADIKAKAALKIILGLSKKLTEHTFFRNISKRIKEKNLKDFRFDEKLKKVYVEFGNKKIYTDDLYDLLFYFIDKLEEVRVLLDFLDILCHVVDIKRLKELAVFKREIFEKNVKRFIDFFKNDLPTYEIDKNLKEHLENQILKVEKLYARYRENMDELKSEINGKKLKKGTEEYKNYLLENVFKNRKHKLPEKLDNMPFKEFKEIYEKYYIDDELDVFSQEFWEIKNYTRGFNKNGLNLSEEVRRFMDDLDYRLVEKAKREIPGLEDIMGRIKSSNFEDLKFDKEKKEVFIEIEGKKISFLNICKVYSDDIVTADEAFALAPFCNLMDLKRLQYTWVSEKIKEKYFNSDLKSVYEKNINNIKNEDVKNYFNNQLEKMKNMFEQYKKENENARKLADKKRESGGLKYSDDYYKYVEKLIFENWNKLFLEDIGIENIRKSKENLLEDDDIKDLIGVDNLIKEDNFSEFENAFNLDD